MKIKLHLTIILITLMLSNISAQKKENSIIRCSSLENEENFAKKFKITNEEQIQHFENWLKPLIDKAKSDQKKSRTTQMILRIPVVFQVLHNGDAVGQNENISDLQLQSQITVLNQDFRRMLNTPGFNNNAVGADVEVEFCLAKIGPDGQATTGINRHLITRASMNMNQIESLKPQYIWDSSKYLNLFVVSFTPTSVGETLGYAQFPFGSGLPGLTPGMSASTANTDSVVLNYKVVGSRAIFPTGTYMNSYDRGRTATHEVGHWLGLRHIWGDLEGCNSGSDFCEDTPNHFDANYSCNTISNSCGYREMTENYMDYSSDNCLNLFTLDQKMRIRTVLLNDPRRSSLILGNKCDSNNYQLDLGVFDIKRQSNCPQDFLIINFINNGLTAVTSAQITINVNGNIQNLSINENINPSTFYNLVTNIPLTNPTDIITATINNVNGAVDNYIPNNTLTKNLDKNYYNTTSNVLNVEFKTDEYSRENSWTFVGPGVYESNTTLSNNTVYNLNLQMLQNGCYTFTMIDNEFDGICCDYGNGNLKITLDNTVIYNDGKFGGSKTIEIRKETLSTGDFGFNNSITLYPNPTNNILNIQDSNNTLPNNYSIYNTLGQIVKQKTISNQDDLAINVQNLTSGVYFIKLDKQGATQTLRFIKN